MRQNRKSYSSEEKIRIIIEGMRGETTIAELCRKEGISQANYYKWSKDFIEAGKNDYLATQCEKQTLYAGTILRKPSMLK